MAALQHNFGFLALAMTFNISVSLLYSLFSFFSVILFSSSIIRIALLVIFWMFLLNLHIFFLTFTLSCLTFFFSRLSILHVNVIWVFSCWSHYLGWHLALMQNCLLKFPMFSFKMIVTFIPLHFHVFQIFSNLHQWGISRNKWPQHPPSFVLCQLAAGISDSKS